MYNTVYPYVPDVQCHIIHVPTLGIQHNTIHLYPMYNTTQFIYVHKVQHNEYTCHDTMITQCTYIVLHDHNTTCMTCTQYHMYTSTICTPHHLYNMSTTTHAQHVHNTKSTQHCISIMCIVPYVCSTTYPTCT